ARIRERITEKNPQLVDVDRVAEEVGVGAIIFADLSGRRTRDWNFVWEEILNFDGRTGPYVQYSHARACSILKKAGLADEQALAAADPALLREDEEWQVIRALSRYPLAVKRAAAAAEPSLVSDAVVAICEAFHQYHTRGKAAEDKRVL